jgi:hypothetical protein
MPRIITELYAKINRQKNTGGDCAGGVRVCNIADAYRFLLLCTQKYVPYEPLAKLTTATLSPEVLQEAQSNKDPYLSIFICFLSNFLLLSDKPCPAAGVLFEGNSVNFWGKDTL